MKTRNIEFLVFTTKIFQFLVIFHGEVITVGKEVCKVRVSITSLRLVQCRECPYPEIRHRLAVPLHMDTPSHSPTYLLSIQIMFV